MQLRKKIINNKKMIIKRFINYLLKFIINCFKHRRCVPFAAIESPPIPFLAPELRTVDIRLSNVPKTARSDGALIAWIIIFLQTACNYVA